MARRTTRRGSAGWTKPCTRPRKRGAIASSSRASATPMTGRPKAAAARCTSSGRRATNAAKPRSTPSTANCSGSPTRSSSARRARARSRRPSAAALDELLAHVQRHFADEEAILERLRYDQLNEHRRAHAGLLRRAAAMTARLEAGELRPGRDRRVRRAGRHRAPPDGRRPGLLPAVREALARGVMRRPPDEPDLATKGGDRAVRRGDRRRRASRRGNRDSRAASRPAWWTISCACSAPARARGSKAGRSSCVPRAAATGPAPAGGHRADCCAR